MRKRKKWWIISIIVAGHLLGIGFVIRNRLSSDGESGQRALAAEFDAAAGQNGREAESAAPEVSIWTCSMHPQIRQPEPGLCPICGMDLVPVQEDGGQAGALREFKTSEAGLKLMEIQTSPVERRYVEAQVRLVGKVAYDETRLRYITAWVPGRLDRLFVDYTGIRVQEGDHMVEIYSPELLAAQEELLQALRAQKELQASDLQIMRTTADRTVAAAREKLRLWGLDSDQIADIEMRGDTVTHLTIRAPASGIVVQKDATEGMYVEPGTRLYTIADLSRVWVNLEAYESDLVWVRYGQQVEMRTEAYPPEVFRGRISFIDPVLDPRTRTVRVRVDVSNEDGQLKPDMLVHATVRSRVARGGRVIVPELAGKWVSPMHPEIIKDGPGQCDVCGMDLVPAEQLGYVTPQEGRAKPSLIIPASAALITGKRAVVYVKAQDADRPTFEGREVVLGPRAGDYFLVRSGLQEGDIVVTRGNFKIDSALQIQAAPSMMTPEGGGGGGHDHAAPAAQGSDAEGEDAHAEHAQEMPAAFLRHLRDVLAAHRGVADAVANEDIQAARDAYAMLAQAVQRLEADALQGHPRLIWRELSMLLRNDGVEGSEAVDVEEARRVLGVLNRHVERLKEAFPAVAVPEPEHRLAPRAFRGQLLSVFGAYEQLHAALASDDLKTALTAAETVQEALSQVDMTLLEHEPHMVWMEQFSSMREALHSMASAESLAGARKQFRALSESLIAALQRFGITGDRPVYVLRCPMAFDNEGGLWLQRGRETENPYYGASMFQCGSVVDVAEPPKPAPAVAAEFQRQLAGVVRAYMDLQAALAADGLPDARAAVDATAAALQQVDMRLLEGAAAHEGWMEHERTMQQALETMQEADSLDAIREQFDELSEALEGALRRLGTGEVGSVHVVHCPMAFGNRGADWLQLETAVQNPYYGASMLQCGTVTETLGARGEETGQRQTEQEHIHE